MSALHVGGWPGFLADDVAGYRWDDDEGRLSVLGWITAIGCDCAGGHTVRVIGVDPTGGGRGPVEPRLPGLRGAG